MTENTIPLGSEPTYKMLTRQELHDTAIERVHHIAQEFTNGFDFLRDYPKSVTVFGSTHVAEDSPYYIKARSLGARIVKDLHYSVFTGGGPGIMEAANRGAFEAGGESLGLTIELTPKQLSNKYLTKNLDFYYFFSRKVCLAFSAEAYVFFPGGFGTLDEFFEIITLVQTGKIEKVPVILVGSDFWAPLHEFMQDQMLTRGALKAGDLNLYTIADTEDQIMDIIKDAPVRNGIEIAHTHHFEEPAIA